MESNIKPTAMVPGLNFPMKEIILLQRIDCRHASETRVLLMVDPIQSPKLLPAKNICAFRMNE